MERTKEVFNALQNVIDEQEERVIGDIKKEAGKRDEALKVLLYSCMSTRLSMSIFSHEMVKC